MRPTSPSKHLLAYGAALTVTVALLAGVASELTLLYAMPFGTFAVGRSGPVATATLWVVVALVVVALAAAVLGPAGIARHAVARGERRRPWMAVWAVAAVLGVALVCATVVVPYAVSTPAGGLVESRTLNRVQPAPPDVFFDADYRSTADGRGVLTITHDGGPELPAENVTVLTTGFADVAGVDQTAAGPWRGDATGTGEDGAPAVQSGDAVTVGVTADCEVRVVFEGPVRSHTLWLYECPGTGESGAAAVGPPGGGRG